MDAADGLGSRAETAPAADVTRSRPAPTVAADDSPNVAGTPPPQLAASPTAFPERASAVPRHFRRASLRVRTDSANQDDTLPPPPKTAEPRPLPPPLPLPPRPPVATMTPIVIKRTTSFSQRLHSLLHREKSHKHSPSAAGCETPTIAYRTPTTQTPSTGVSANPSAAASADNSPPGGVSPHTSSVHLGHEPAAYRAQRNFAPVPENKVFAVSHTNLRSVNRHNRQLEQAFQGAVASPADELADRVDHLHVAPKRLSGPAVSREPSQTTLRHQSSAAEGEGDSDSVAAVVGTPGTPDVCHSMLAHKKSAPVYSTHKASLNQFGRQTKVIGTGTGGTVRLLQGVDLGARPPSLRSAAPSSHYGDEPSAYVPSQHKLFAVKEFRKRHADETPRAYMKKVTSEFCIGSSIHHENVIETLDLIFEGDRVYEIMEYCPHDLFTFVVNANMDLDETFCWFKQVCLGVRYLHRIGIAHRDLKLENCLLTDRGVVKIIDFGCATVYKTPFQKEPGQVVGVCGSDPYIAPEVLMSRRQIAYYAQVADVWSVGIMYMCMTLLKFPWRLADTEADRSYGSYIRDWPRGREKLFAQLPKLRHDGKSVIEGMVYPEAKGRLTMDQVADSEWMKEIDCCHAGHSAKSHVHSMQAA
ncbi:serine/threonine protein kinase [Coemansia nantahalensis]|uniref:Serine/threonine protein kinase n=2 Tax=Coemansia TaxID=4863 RepID=A0ACC1JW06_9FUNG|nr:serine/threonine protein kinase [Coemansia nantahalensis]